MQKVVCLKAVRLIFNISTKSVGSKPAAVSVVRGVDAVLTYLLRGCKFSFASETFQVDVALQCFLQEVIYYYIIPR